MGCNRGCGGKRATSKYVWTSADGETTMDYASEIEAKAKVFRKGGSYKAVLK